MVCDYIYFKSLASFAFSLTINPVIIKLYNKETAGWDEINLSSLAISTELDVPDVVSNDQDVIDFITKAFILLTMNLQDSEGVSFIYSTEEIEQMSSNAKSVEENELQEVSNKLAALRYAIEAAKNIKN